MTAIVINDITPRDEYTAAGSQTTFSYSFPIFDEDQLTVYETVDGVTVTRVIGSGDDDYDVTGVGEAAGGDIEFTTAREDGALITIVRTVPYQRVTNFTAGPYTPDAINRELSLIEMQMQQVVAVSERSFRLPDESQSAASLEVPEPEAGYVIGWSDDGLALENIVSVAEISAAADNAESAAESAAAAAASAASATTFDPGIAPDEARPSWSFGTAADRNIGASAGNVPDLDSDAKLAAGVMPLATVTAVGAVEKATTAEAQGGTEADKFPDVVGVAAAIAAQQMLKERFVSAAQTVTLGALLTLAHSLSARPYLIVVYLKCISADLNYATDDYVLYLGDNSGTADRGLQVYADATNVYVRFGSGAVSLLNKTTGATGAIDVSKWSLVVVAYDG